jgi:regulator of protease activity HflC (stomatin/prohibitin superfamily)
MLLVHDVFCSIKESFYETTAPSNSKNNMTMLGRFKSATEEEKANKPTTPDLENVELHLNPSGDKEPSDGKYPWSKSATASTGPPDPLTREQIRNRWIGCGVFTFVLVLTGIVLLITSLRKLESTEYGVEYNTHSKQLEDASKSGGLFTGPPGFKFIKFPSTFITVDQQATCVSKDGLRVDFQLSFQYQLVKEYIINAILKYRNFDKWATLVEAAGSSAVQHACSQYIISDFQYKRGEIQRQIELDLQLKLEGDPEVKDDYGVYARMISVQLRNVDLPFEYRDAVSAKQSAQEDISLAQNQRRQELTKANTALLAAKEEARKILDTARNEAEVLLTEATLKAEETTFAFGKEAETIIDVKTNLNLTTEGVLAYLANELLGSTPYLKVTTGEPARLARSDEL